MLEGSMHEHVCHCLIQTEVGSLEIVQAEDVVEVNAPAAQHHVCQIAYNVDDEQIFCYRWYLSHNIYAKLQKKGHKTL